MNGHCRRTQGSVIAVVALFCATLALASSSDGVILTLTKAPLPSISLEWTNGSPPIHVYRSTIASTVTDAANKIADTNATSYVDTPPAEEILFYVVTAGCPAGTVACGSVCADLSSDPLNCGTCGVSCGNGASCGSGVCFCPAGQVSCSSGCADLSSDPLNCGTCGVSCGNGGSCGSGVCN